MLRSSPLWGGIACFCEYCVAGWETLCESQRNTGYSIDGGFAEFAKADARFVVKVPSGIDPAEAAPLTCAGVTMYKAVKVGGTRPTDLVSGVRRRRTRPSRDPIRGDRRRPSRGRGHA